MYLGRKICLFRPSVEFAVQVKGEQARAQGKCFLRVEDEYCNHTRSKRSLSPKCTSYFLPSGPKILLLLPETYRKGCISGLVRQKNRIRTTGENKECLRSHHGHSLLLLPRGVIYYFVIHVLIFGIFVPKKQG